MNFLEVLRQTFATFRAHKMRSFLTMFGIVWGIASVILLVGLGIGFGVDQRARMKTLGTDLLILWGGRTSSQAGGLAAGREVRLNIRDAYLVQQECYLIKSVSPELRRSVPQVSQYNSANRAVAGIWPEYQRFRSLNLAEGRLLTLEDEREARRVVVLGFEAQQQLFPGKPALGALISIKGSPYTVVGLLEKKKQNSVYGSPDNGKLFVPYSAMARDFPPPERPGIERGYLSNLVLEVANPEEHEEAVRQVRRVLGRAHHFNEDDKDAIFVWDTMRGAKFMQKVFGAMTIFFGAVALMTLCLGGIGVMNIMLVAVTERTREIGVRKAMGATRSDILRQFFAEAATLTAVSGLLGFSLGVGICLVMKNLTLPDFIPAPVISPTAIIASVLTLSLVTVTAGMYPAQRAAEMEPVDSLRYE